MQEKAISHRISEAIRGDGASLAMLFQLYRPRLYAHACRLLGNTPRVQDALQDAFLTALTNVSALRDAKAFYPWLRKILLNHCYLALRREKPLKNYLESLPEDSLIETSIEQRLEKTADTGRIYQALNGLSGELRSCVLLKYFSHFSSYEEIALILDIPVGTVRSRLSAAREKLHEHYASCEDSNDKIFAQARHWSEFYHEIWGNFYDDPASRKQFIDHLDPALNLRFTSGKTGTGISLLENEFNDDLTYGSRYTLKEVSSCGNISVLEGNNRNSPEYPDRCAPSTVLVLFRKNDKTIETCHVFDSQRAI